MKKYFLITIIIVLSIISACKKNIQQNADINNNSPTSTIIDNQTSTMTDDLIEAKIKDFLVSIKNPDKSLSDMNIENAIWNIEAALNYSLCKPYLRQNNSIDDSLLIAVPINNGMISSINIAEAYQNCMSKMKNSESLSPYIASHFVAADIALKNSDDINATLKLTFVLAETDNGSKALLPFGSTDYWVWANNGGKCNGYTGTGDAAQQIKTRINNNLTFQQGTYFTDVVIVPDVNYIHYQMAYGGNEDNIQDYLMFENYNGLPNFHTCIPPSEMNFHMNGTNTMLYRFVANGGPRPAGKIPISIHLFGEYGLGMPYFPIFHTGQFRYGIAHIGNPG